MFVLFIGANEVIVILLAILLLFGAKAIPELARGLGKAVHEFNKATTDIKQELNNTTQSNEIDDEVQQLINNDEKNTPNTPL